MNRMMKPRWLPLTLIISSIAYVGASLATPSETIIAQYNQAANGDKDKVTEVYEQLTQNVASNGADGLSLVYLGSTQTLMGRDAWMPWNKMKHTEQGLATISKGLDLVAANPTPIQEQQIRQGLPESLLAKAIAGATFTALPDMFNHFERGYDLYIELLDEPAFAAQGFDATSWIYIYAIKAAIRAEDLNQAKQWLAQMEHLNKNHPMTLEAQAIINGAA